MSRTSSSAALEKSLMLNTSALLETQEVDFYESMLN